MNANVASIGNLLRSWRELRHLSQLDLALEAEISQKHLSFLESGRSTPSREMILHLSKHLDVPLRERNAMLLAAGFAPAFKDRPLSDPALAQARASIERLLKAHEPYPALTLDRQWNILSANRAVWSLLGAVDSQLLKPPVNVLRISLHPSGLAPHIVNFGEWRSHLLERAKRQWRLTRDPALEALLKEVSDYKIDGHELDSGASASPNEIAIPLRLRVPGGTLSFLSTVTVFGTALEISLAELTLETFYPADAETASALLAQTTSER
ncbi:MAG TPA: helix-turn-helix transcriptional regulator [Candidatus Angelobacter sp.]|nr:helix-turn-helix transcriptional regulator [Candidatus Angelobacter sp.]